MSPASDKVSELLQLRCIDEAIGDGSLNFAMIGTLRCGIDDTDVGSFHERLIEFLFFRGIGTDSRNVRTGLDPIGANQGLFRRGRGHDEIACPNQVFQILRYVRVHVRIGQRPHQCLRVRHGPVPDQNPSAVRYRAKTFQLQSGLSACTDDTNPLDIGWCEELRRYRAGNGRAHVRQVAFIVQYCQRITGFRRANQHQANARFESYGDILVKAGGDLDDKMGVSLDVAILDVALTVREGQIANRRYDGIALAVLVEISFTIVAHLVDIQVFLYGGEVENVDAFAVPVLVPVSGIDVSCGILQI